MNKNERLLVGIAAPTCSGKTTLVRELVQRLDGDATVLSFDEYDLYPSGSMALEDALRIGGIRNWEDPSLFDCERYLQDLQRLKAGQQITLLARSRESKSEGTQIKTIQPKKVTIVEGVFTFSDPRADALFDRCFYIEIPIDEMVRRRLARTPEGSTDPWDQRSYIEVDMIAGTEYYVRPQRSRADVVLDGLQPTAELVNRIIREISGNRL